MTPKEFLAACFGQDAAKLSKARGSWADIDWEEVIKTARHELLLPAVHKRFSDLGIVNQLPPDLPDFFLAVQELNAERNEAIFTELAFVAQLLNQKGIEPVLLKGAASCAVAIYQNPAARYLWDVDLLIPEQQLSMAVDILLANGFTPSSTDRLGRFRHHYPPLQRNGSIFFELHRSLGLGICSSLLPASEVVERSVVIDFRGSRVRIPAPTDLMTHLIMHSQIRHPYQERIWPPLRAMLDFVRLNRSFKDEIDWSTICRRFRTVKQSGVLELHLLDIHDALGEPPPFPMHLTTLTKLRRLRRRVLSRVPALRFIDPVYMYSVVLAARLRLLRNVLTHKGGWQNIAIELFSAGLYRRLAADIKEGRGR
jgi:hypothetical protein